MPSWLVRVFQFLKGFGLQIWAEWQRNQRMVDAGAQELKDKEAKDRAGAVEDAKHTKEKVDALPDSSVDAELSGWLRPDRKDNRGSGTSVDAGDSTKATSPEDKRKA